MCVLSCYLVVTLLQKFDYFASENTQGTKHLNIEDGRIDLLVTILLKGPENLHKTLIIEHVTSLVTHHYSGSFDHLNSVLKHGQVEPGVYCAIGR